MATLQENSERFLIYLATIFLCGIVLVVPIIIAIVLFSGSQDTESITFSQEYPENEWNFLSFLDAKNKTKIDSIKIVERPVEVLNTTFDAARSQIKRKPYNLDLAPDCPTCPYIGVSKYFKFSKYGCPDFLNTPECCYCNKVRPKPPKPEMFNKGNK